MPDQPQQPAERTPVEEKAVHRAAMEAINAAFSGRVTDAIRMLSDNPLIQAHFAGVNYLGSLLVQSGDAAGALAAFDRSIALKPDYADAWCNRGVALQRLGRHAEALAAYDETLTHAPSNAVAHFNRANLLARDGAFEAASAAYERAILLDPRLFDAWLNRGIVAMNLGDAEAALRSFEGALALRPDSREATQGRAAALQRLGRRGEAVHAGPAPAAEEVPGVDAAVARGRALIELERPSDALSLLSKVTASGRQGARIAIVRSAALWKLGRTAEALPAARAAARLDPASADIHEEYAYLLLKLGDFERGLEEYEFRLDKAPGRWRRANFRAPAWQGEDLTGKHIIVSPEQGLGDTVQFVRYLPLLIGRGARVTAVVQKPLLGVMRSMRSPIRWLGEVPADETFDYQVPLMSLACRFATRLETIPREVPYLFAESERVARWRGRIGPEGLRIGVVWQGNPEYASDPSRSIPLAEFAPLAAVPGVRLVSLQAQRGLAQLARLPAGMRVESLGADITANPEGMSEIAAAMEALDLIVTSDTAVAHLAGALGRPVWVALAHDPDWRWLMEREDSPWYPTMRLFRQPNPGDWPSVFAAISKALA